MPKEANYRTRYKLLLARYVDLDTGEMIDIEFKRKVLEMRAQIGVKGYGLTVHRFITQEYRFPSAMHEFVQRYIKDGTLNFDLIGANLFLVAPSQEEAISGRDKTLRSGVLRYARYCMNYGKVEMPSGTYDGSTFRASKELKLVIGKNASIEQIVDFIRTNKEQLKQFQQQLKDDGEFGTRIRQRKNLRRDMRIRELKEQRKTHRIIANTINDEFPNAQIAYGDIPSILRNLK